MGRKGEESRVLIFWWFYHLVCPYKGYLKMKFSLKYHFFRLLLHLPWILNTKKSTMEVYCSYIKIKKKKWFWSSHVKMSSWNALKMMSFCRWTLFHLCWFCSEVTVLDYYFGLSVSAEWIESIFTIVAFKANYLGWKSLQGQKIINILNRDKGGHRVYCIVVLAL